jgi:hypothetical protein
MHRCAVPVVAQGLLNMSLPDVLAQWVGANQANAKLPQVSTAQQQRRCTIRSTQMYQHEHGAAAS